MDAAPRKGRRPGYVLYAPWRGFRERPWFDALFFREPALSRRPPTTRHADMFPSLTTDEWRRIVQVLSLTPRETDIVRLLMQAQGDKQIATTLGISVSTVRTHLRHVFATHHVTDRAELILRIFALLRQPAKATSSLTIKRT